MYPYYTFIHTSTELIDLGKNFASQLISGDLVVLTGPLGVGKTTLTKGIALGLDIHDRITSPTFTLAKIYPVVPSKNITLTHIDAYRVNSIEELEILDISTALISGVVVMEWGEKFAADLSDHYYQINLDFMENTETRKISIMKM